MPSPQPMKRWAQGLARHLAEPQHRNAYALMLNGAVGAAAGFLFWLLAARLASLAPTEVGIGYAVVALATAVALVAKGGLDMALLLTVPGTGRRGASRLLRLGLLLGAASAVLLALMLAAVSRISGLFPQTTWAGWALVAAIAALLVATWLQDAYFLAEGDARPSLRRNLVLAAARLALIVPVALLGLPDPIALAWAAALAASALFAAGSVARLAWRDGPEPPRRAFLRSAVHNLPAGAAEFLPGLLLPPLVLALQGPTAAAYFGMAWAVASMLFLACAAISRSLLAELMRAGPSGHASVLRSGGLQHARIVAPAALACALLAFPLLSLFGPAYAAQGAPILVLLCATTLFVAPIYLYLAVLRCQGRRLPLVAFPAALVAALALLAPPLTARFGLMGAAVAWTAANVPFGAYAAWKLLRTAREVTHRDAAAPLHRGADLE